MEKMFIYSIERGLISRIYKEPSPKWKAPYSKTNEQLKWIDCNQKLLSIAGHWKNANWKLHRDTILTAEQIAITQIY